MLLHAPQDLGAVNLAQDHLRHSHARRRERHTPAVAVKHRQRVQIDVSHRHPGVPSEGGCVHPDIAMGELDPLRTSGRPAGVVDRGRRVLIGRHGPRLDALREDRRVGFVTEDEAVLDVDARNGIGELGIDHQHRRAGMLDDVLDLRGAESKVDGHQHPSEARDPEERHEHARRVLRQDGDALAHAHSQGIESCGLGSRKLANPPVAERPETPTWSIGLVMDTHSVTVNVLGPVQEIRYRKVDFHVHPPQELPSLLKVA